MAKIVSLQQQPIIHADMSDAEQVSALRDLIDGATGPAAHVLTITPAMAKAITAPGVSMRNRQLRNTKVSRFTKAMKERAWVLNGETLVFEGGKAMDGLGRLANGYHRSLACIRSGRPFTTFAVFGIEASAFRSLDTGTSRNIRDAFQVEDIPNPGVVPYAVRWIKILTGPDPYDRGMTMENTEAIAFYRTLDTVRLHSLVKSASAISNRCKRLLPKGQILAFLYLAKPNVARRAGIVLASPHRNQYSQLHEFMKSYRERNVRIDENVRTIALRVAFDAIRNNKPLTQREIKDALLDYRTADEPQPRKKRER